MRSTSSSFSSVPSFESLDFDFPFPLDLELEVTLAFEGVFVRLRFEFELEGGKEVVEGGAETLLLEVGFEGDAERAGKSDSDGGAVEGLNANVPAPGFKLFFCTVGLVDTDLCGRDD